MDKLKLDIIKILSENIRESDDIIAKKLGISTEKAKKEIGKIFDEKHVLQFVPIFNPNKKQEKNGIFAVIEVSINPEKKFGFDRIAKQISNFSKVLNVFLVSGTNDITIEVFGNSVQDIGKFVAEEIATIDGVKGSFTKFVLKKYKEKGVNLDENSNVDFLPVNA